MLDLLLGLVFLFGSIVSMVKRRSPKPKFEVRVLVDPPSVRRSKPSAWQARQGLRRRLSL